MKIISLVFILALSLFSQKIVPVVSVKSPRLTEIQKEEIEDLAEQVQTYVSEKEWISNDFEDEITCNISIIIESVKETSTTKQYTSQFVITSTAQESFYDKKFVFIYDASEEISPHGNQSYQLANVLDFYMNMVLAGELDTYELYGGDEFYGKAREALSLGLNSAQTGWEDREKVLKNYTSSLILPMRKAKFMIYTSLNFLEEKAFVDMRKNTIEIVKELGYAFEGSPNNVALKRYFEAYHQKLIQTLDPAQDGAHIHKLIQIDPARKAYYSKYVE